MLTERVKQEIKEHCSGKDTESCGLILFKKEYFTYPSENNSEYNRRENFRIKPRDYLKATYFGEIMGFYHSHTNDNPEASEVDKVRINDESKPWVIYHTISDKFTLLSPNNYQNPYIGRNYLIGKSDCFALIREYYRKELNIDIRDYSRDKNWAEINPKIMVESYEKEGFREVNDLKKNDLIMIKYMERNEGGHLGIYLGNGSLLHHPPERFSLIEPYTNAYKRRTYLTLRHKNCE